MLGYEFDRWLRYDELQGWLHAVAHAHPELVELETYGQSNEGRDLVLVTITDSATGPATSKPAHWVDASIHAVELTATAAACYLVERLITGYNVDDTVTRALQTRTFYIVPRVNPDGAEWVLADRPKFRRSSTRPWPWADDRRWPGLESEDIDGDGRILQMRIADPDGAWRPHPDDQRLMIPVPAEGAPPSTPTYRLLSEGSIASHDGFTVPTPRPVEGLDLNRNFPAGWGSAVAGAGDHPLSEPEIDALVRAAIARPNICGYNAFHTSGGVILRPSSTMPDSKLPPVDVWIFKQLAERGTEFTSYPSHSVYEDFTWDTTDVMSGAGDDWAYEHLGVYGWTTEFWDIVLAATGEKQSTHFWYTGPTDEQSLGVLRWCDQHNPGGYVDWYAFEHPQLGDVELGGWNDLTTWTNPPLDRLRDEIVGHADFAVHQALCAPALSLPYHRIEKLGPDTWSVEVGIANTGWLPTDVSAWARKHKLALPMVAEIALADGSAAEITGGNARQQLGQLEGRVDMRFAGGNDGTPDRTLARWVITAPAGSELVVTATHPRAGQATRTITLAT